jgi:DNA sulfur modification protein DndB
VVLFPWEDLDRVQQMFSDLNRTARTTSKSLNILYNHRDLLSQVALTVTERLPVFSRFVDKDRISLPLRSPKLFTLGAIYDGTLALLESVTHPDYEQKLAQCLEFWETVAKNMPLWGQVEAGDLKPADLRQEFICTHAVVLWALGAMGRTLISEHPTEWQRRLEVLKAIDWRRTNREWQGVAMSGSDVDNSDSDWKRLRYLEQACELVTNCDWFPKTPRPPPSPLRLHRTRRHPFPRPTETPKVEGTMPRL